MLILFTDTDTDMTPKMAKEYGYKLISMPYSVNGKETKPYVDFEEFDSHAFYEMLRAGTIPNTSALNAETYKEYFEPYFANGDDILYVHFSSAMSASFGAMKEAVDEMLAKYPDRKFYEIDTKGISILSLNIVMEVGDMIKAGKTPEEVVEWAKTEVDHFAVYFFADDLKFFKHSGRVSGLAGTMGTLLGIRPIIYVNDEGKMVNIGKEKGRAKAIEKILDYMEQLGDKIGEHRIFVANADATEISEQIIERIKERFGADLKVEMFEVNPTIGSHCGPNATGVSFHSIHR